MSPWVRLDDHLDDDARFATVGPAGTGWLVLLLVYSNKTLSDGFVSAAIVRQKSLGLDDPETNQVVFIGATSVRPSRRLAQRLSAARRRSRGAPIAVWIRSELSAGRRPILRRLTAGWGEEAATG